PWLVGELYFRIRKREGLGLGDGMLLALVGALLGWKGVFVSLFGGSVVGSVIGLTVVMSRRREADESEDGAQASLGGTELPFGPSLAIAAVFSLFAEPWLQLHFRFAGG